MQASFCRGTQIKTDAGMIKAVFVSLCGAAEQLGISLRPAGELHREALARANDHICSRRPFYAGRHNIGHLFFVDQVACDAG